MATSKASDEKEAPAEKGTAASPKNPSGASEAQLKKGEMTGQVRGPDVDKSFHVYEFTDPMTGEPVEGADTKQSEGANQGEAGEVKPESGKAPK